LSQRSSMRCSVPSTMCLSSAPPSCRSSHGSSRRLRSVRAATLQGKTPNAIPRCSDRHCSPPQSSSLYTCTFLCLPRTHHRCSTGSTGTCRRRTAQRRRRPRSRTDCHGLSSTSRACMTPRRNQRRICRYRSPKHRSSKHSGLLACNFRSCTQRGSSDSIGSHTWSCTSTQQLCPGHSSSTIHPPNTPALGLESSHKHLSQHCTGRGVECTPLYCTPDRSSARQHPQRALAVGKPYNSVRKWM